MNHSWRFTRQKIASRLTLIAPMVHRRAEALTPFRLMEVEGARLDAPICAPFGDWPEIPHESYWGRADLNFVMKTSFAVPAGWDGDNIALHLPLGVLGDIFNHPEALTYVDQVMIGSADRYHHTLPLVPHLADGRDHILSLHGWTGHAGWPPDPDSKAKLFMGTPQIVERDPEVLAFVELARSSLDTANVLEPASAEANGLLSALDAAFHALDTRDPLGEDFYASVPEAHAVLQQGIKAAGAPLDVTLHGIGHAHMDIAYLWSIDQMRLKNARTYSNVLRLMDQDPEFRFSHSQPKLYEMTEEDHPQLFAKIRERVVEGRWEVMGGMWVEPDLNIPGGESLVRQLVLGRQYFSEKFGDVETPVLWLPDSFGFPGQIPQLMKLAGLKWFVTNKLNWNQINRVPWSTHIWSGIDGSQVLAHVLTTPRDVQYLPFPTNYKSDLTAKEVLGTVRHTIGGDPHDLPICYGYGDGGGGPTEELLMKARHYGAMPGMPRLKMSSVRATMEALEQDEASLPVWEGEHYLEGHRGVFTSQAWIKRANRKAEAALHEAEALAAMAGIEADLEDAWKTLCLNQFHDIVTGTSIPQVFADARLDFARIMADAEAVAIRAASQLRGAEPRVLNMIPTCGQRVIETTFEAGRPGQSVEGGTLYLLPDLPAYSATPLSQACLPDEPVTARREGRGYVLENALIRLRFNEAGQIADTYDKTNQRGIIQEKKPANQFQFFEDRPICWDAWDIDPHFEDRQENLDAPADISIMESGPIRAALKVTHRFRASTITQYVRLDANARRVDFVTDVDWHERHVLLKVAFPVAFTALRAGYDVQWGRVERATARHTAFDAARFEVPAQKWASLSWGQDSIALLNDCKYGYDARPDTLRLTLIKSSTAPDPQADQGHHAFTYALLINPGNDTETLNHAAYDLNQPARLVAPAEAPQTGFLGRLFGDLPPNVVLETVKPAFDGSGMVLRLFECSGADTQFTFTTHQPIKTAWLVDIFEARQTPCTITENGLDLSLRGYEICTLMVNGPDE